MKRYWVNSGTLALTLGEVVIPCPCVGRLKGQISVCVSADSGFNWVGAGWYVTSISVSHIILIFFPSVHVQFDTFPCAILKRPFVIDTSCFYFTQNLLRINMVIMIFSEYPSVTTYFHFSLRPPKIPQNNKLPITRSISSNQK